MLSRRASKKNDAELVSSIADGDPDALAELFDRYAPRLLGLIAVIMGDRREADDVLQETFVNVWRRADSYRHEMASVAVWLITIARSRAIDAMRRRRREPDFRPLGSSEECVATDGSSDSRRRVLAASTLSSLTRSQREAVELAFFRGLTHTQIARHQDVPLGTVKTRIRSGLTVLKEAMEQHRETANP